MPLALDKRTGYLIPQHHSCFPLALAACWPALTIGSLSSAALVRGMLHEIVIDQLIWDMVPWMKFIGGI